ncbi:integrase [Catenulispora subtropica]|uniref:integrase n=1 Tax=Catenulispora subtropica TaxID=450798 RepID=UPI0031DE3FED
MFDPAEVREQAKALAPRYGDPVWPFHVISKNPSSTGDAMHWNRFPDGLREQFRHAAWALARFPLDEVYQVRHGSAMRTRLSASRRFKTVNEWLKFALWMDRRGIGKIGAVTVDDLLDYDRYLVKEQGLARSTCTSLLVGLSRLHAYSSKFLPKEHRLIEPPWVEEGLDDYLPAASALGENSTAPITPETMGGLLIWAMRFVELFADDILAAWNERERLLERVRTAEARPAGEVTKEPLRRYLDQLIAEGRPLPRMASADVTGLKWDVGGATTFIAGLTGTPRATVISVLRAPRFRSYAAANPGPCLLGTPVKGMLDGRPWHQDITFTEVVTLMRHLVTSCFVIISYLTGMRVGEVLGLEVGCCPDPQGPPEAPKRFLIRGREFKGARDEDGNHLSDGVVREAGWVAIPQVVTAIRLLESIAGEGLLFDALVHDVRSPEQRSGRSLSTSTMANRIEYFVKWVNNYVAANGRVGETIEREEGERLAPLRFRRTLAWHIARRPGGLVALAVQYGHMRTIVSAGYASRSRDGIHHLLDLETARTVAEHLSDVHEALEEGQGVSGPAARRLIASAKGQHERFGGIVATTRQAKALLADPTLNVFENKKAYLTCNWDRSKALCEIGRAKSDVPSLDRCQSSCANIARTDRHAEQLAAESASLRQQADSGLLPEPIADRLRAKAETFDELVTRHRADRITLADREEQ